MASNLNRSNWRNQATVLLVFCLAGMFFSLPAAAQEGLFRTPTLAKSEIARRTDNGPRVVPASPHLASHRRVDLGVKQRGEQESSNEQDPIESWLPEGQVQEEELPDFSSPRSLSDSRFIDEGVLGNEIESNEQSGAGNREVIIQRYPEGKPQIERQVIEDENGNYVNDGFWRVLSQQDERVVIAQGQYRRGMMEGVWMRKHAKDSSGLFATRPFTMFEGPFVSIATFKENKLDGVWTLQDNTNQKMFEVPYRGGQRNGTASWWYPSQNKMREVTFVDGAIHGRLREWDEQKKLIRDEEYIEGQRVIRNVTYFRPQQLETENYFLDAKLEVDGEDDWWRAEPARLVANGTRVQHGPVNFWYENGLPKMKGNYFQGQRQGRFLWYHPNGNKQLEGAFVEGKKIGRWRWWHANGMKASEGVYEDDVPVGTWTWWNDKGQVEDRKDFSDSDSADDDKASRSILDTGAEGNPEEMPLGPTGSANPASREPANTTRPTPQSADDRDVITLELDGLEELKPREGTTPKIEDGSSGQLNSGRNSGLQSSLGVASPSNAGLSVVPADNQFYFDASILPPRENPSDLDDLETIVPRA